MHSHKMKFTVGLFVLSTFIIFFITLFLFLKDKGSFDDRNTYHFTTSSAQFFTLGMPVTFSGFTIATIENIILQDDGDVKMDFSVNEKNTKWLTDGSVLIVIKPLLGAPYIELYTSLGSKTLENGAALPINISDNINDLIVRLQPVVLKTVTILNNVETITSYLAREDSQLVQVLNNLNTFTGKLANDDSLLTSLTGSEKSTQDIISTLNETKLIMKDVKQITSEMSKISTSLQADIVTPTSHTIQELNAIMKDVKSKLNALNGTVSSIGDADSDFVLIKEQVAIGIKKSNEILDKVDSIMQDKESSEVYLP